MCACACAHNYRCAIPPKLSLEKGMGMTPGYNHRLRLRNMLPLGSCLIPETAEKLPAPSQRPCLRTWCSKTEPVPGRVCCPPPLCSLFHFIRNSTVCACVLGLCLAASLCLLGGSAAVPRASVRGRSEPGCSLHPGMLPVALRQKRKRYLELYRRAGEGQEGLMFWGGTSLHIKCAHRT